MLTQEFNMILCLISCGGNNFCPFSRTTTQFLVLVLDLGMQPVQNRKDRSGNVLRSLKVYISDTLSSCKLPLSFLVRVGPYLGI